MHDDFEEQMRIARMAWRRLPVTCLVVLYVATVLAVDAAASIGLREPINWQLFNWGPREVLHLLDALHLRPLLGWLAEGPMRQFDWFKFITWFLIPFCCSLPGMVWKALGVRGWKKRDWAVLLIIGAGGMLVMYCIPLFVALREIYPDLSQLAPNDKSAFFWGQICWMLSWLPGWEFMHRYFLLDRVSVTWPRFGWLLLPLFEGLYHLQKPGPEAMGMVVFSVFLTLWAMRRRNVLLPFLAHFFIELDLVLFLLFL